MNMHLFQLTTSPNGSNAAFHLSRLWGLPPALPVVGVSLPLQRGCCHCV